MLSPCGCCDRTWIGNASTRIVAVLLLWCKTMQVRSTYSVGVVEMLLYCYSRERRLLFWCEKGNNTDGNETTTTTTGQEQEQEQEKQLLPALSRFFLLVLFTVLVGSSKTYIRNLSGGRITAGLSVRMKGVTWFQISMMRLTAVSVLPTVRFTQCCCRRHARQHGTIDGNYETPRGG